MVLVAQTPHPRHDQLRKIEEVLIQSINPNSQTPRARKCEDDNDGRDKHHSRHKNPRCNDIPYRQTLPHRRYSHADVIVCPHATMLSYPHSDRLLITTHICGWNMNSVYIDTRSNTNVILKEMLEKLKVSLSQIRHSFGPMFSITQDILPILGVVKLSLMRIGDTIHKIQGCYSIIAEFLVLDLPSFFNAIIRLPSQVEFNK